MALGHHTTASPVSHKCVQLATFLELVHSTLTTRTTMAHSSKVEARASTELQYRPAPP